MTQAVLEKPSQEEVQIKQNGEKAQAREPRRVVAPVSKVSQNEKGFSLTVELPGVLKENLDIQVEGQALTIQATSNAPDWVNYENVYREFDFVDYEAQFRLPNGLDRSGIKAEFNNGLLQLELPKAAEQMPRKISINA
jgi:HSP20 family molecular chaperone IbpA